MNSDTSSRGPRLILSLIVVLSIMGSWMIGGPSEARAIQTGQDPARDLRDAEAAARDLFQLADEGKYNAMYDRIHPDAHAVIPRVAAVGTFDALYAIAQVGRAEITDVSIGEWTWPVTGKTYEYTAQIRFRQPYVEDGRERMLDDEMYLVPRDGEWRWFFGSDQELIDIAIQEFGGESEGTALTDGDLISNVVEDLDIFWRDVLSYSEFNYYSPGVVLVEAGETARSGCGRTSSGFWAFYCPLDQTIYLDGELLSQLEEQADFAVAFIVAHEWAHHIQTGVGIERVEANQRPDDWNELYSIELELMADCLSGAWTLDLDTRGLLELDDVEEAMGFAVQYLGDPEYIDVYDPQAHGSAELRVESFVNGYEDGFLGCNESL